MKTVKFSPFAPLLIGALLAASLVTAQAAEKKPADKGSPKAYPLDVCIVTDNDLGSMGEEQVIVYEGQTIKFCCKPCDAKFRKNPAKYLAKLNPPEPAK
jgi:hypothetical protein